LGSSAKVLLLNYPVDREAYGLTRRWARSNNTAKSNVSETHVRQYARRLRNDFRDKRAFARLAPIPCDVSALAATHDLDLQEVLQRNDDEWDSVQREIEPLRIADTIGGVNPGDRRALYSIIKYLKPTSVLEIGTHIGASTVHIARALKDLQARNSDTKYELTSVDIVNVNDPVSGPWTTYGSTYSPADMMHRLGCERSVTFHTENSLDYLSKCDKKYDLIFLDDNHDAAHVYQEIPLALTLLKPNNYMVLHDFFPDNRRLWANSPAVQGPWLATQRLENEGAAIKVLPLGTLPWPTKHNSNVTSLALLGRA
jgi:predicted O-methyltransferase YrrM